MLKVGQVISDRGTRGIVTKIYGEQRPETVRSIAGVLHTGGGSEFDIVYSDDSLHPRVPESILYASYFRISDEIVSAEDVAAALQRAEKRKQEINEKEAEEKRLFNLYVERLKEDESLSYLSQDCRHLAATNIRRMLKKHFPSIKFSVTQDYPSLYVKYVDGIPKQEVKELIQRFEAGHFDGMRDIYEYRDTPFNTVFGSVKYLFVERDYSDESIILAIDYVYQEYSGNLKEIERPAPDRYRSGHTRIDIGMGNHYTLQYFITKFLDEFTF